MKPAIAPGLPLVAAIVFASGAAHAQYSTPMRDVENPDRFSYQESATGTIPIGQQNTVLEFPTPAGRRYVIEQVGVFCSTSAVDVLPLTSIGVLRIAANSSLTGNVLPIQMQRQGTYAFSTVWSGTARVRLFADPQPQLPNGGAMIQLNIFHSDTSVTTVCNGTVVGHSIAP